MVYETKMFARPKATQAIESANGQRRQMALSIRRPIPWTAQVWFSLSDSTGSIALKLPHQMEGGVYGLSLHVVVPGQKGRRHMPVWHRNGPGACLGPFHVNVTRPLHL